MELPHGESIVDTHLLMDQLDNDLTLVAEIIDLFIEDCPHRIAALRAAVASRDPRALENAAHSLKSSIGNFGAQRAYQLAQALEHLGRSGRIDGCDELAQELEERLSQLVDALRSFPRPPTEPEA